MIEIPPGVAIDELVVHIPSSESREVIGRLNLVTTGPIQDLRQRQNELVYTLDLRRHQGRHFALGDQSNTLEIRVGSRARETPSVFRWVLAAPKDPEGWRTSDDAQSPETASAGLAAEGISLVERYDDGRTFPLTLGLTSARQVLLRVPFERVGASIGLRVGWTGNGEARRIAEGHQRFGVGRGVVPVAPGTRVLEVPVELALGENTIEVEVLHGDVTLVTNRFRIVRQRPSRPGDVDGDRWAVVVGVSDYRNEGVPDLRFAHRDAEAVRDVLMARGGFEPRRIITLLDGGATLSNLRAALGTFLAQTAPEDLVLIYLAGHGVSDPVDRDSYYFLPHDARRDAPAGTAYPLREIGAAMGLTIRAQQIVVMADMCHSGGALEIDTLEPSGLNFVNKYLETLARSKGRLIVTASQAHERSIEREALGHGVFTHRLLSGLEGDADTDHDSTVTLNELVEYVRHAVKEDTSGQQNPSFRSLAFDMNLALAYGPFEPHGVAP